MQLPVNRGASRRGLVDTVQSLAKPAFAAWSSNPARVQMSRMFPKSSLPFDFRPDLLSPEKDCKQREDRRTNHADTSAGNPKTRGPGNLTGGLTFLASHPADLGLQLFDLLFQIPHSRAKFFQAVSLRDSPIHASQNGPHRIPGQIGHTARSRQRTKMQKRRVLLLGKPNANHAGTGLHDCHGRLTGTGPQDARGFKKERRNEGEQTALWSANSKTAQPPQRYCSLSIAPQTPGRLRPF